MESLVDKYKDHGTLAVALMAEGIGFSKMQMAHICFRVTLKMVRRDRT